MNDNHKTPPFNPDIVSRLFKLCLDSDSAPDNLDDDYKRTLLLRDLLGDIPPLRSDILQGIPALLQQLHQALPRSEGKNLGQFLQDPKTPADELRIAKDYAKQATKSAQKDAEYEVAGVVYYAAIAAALVHHGIRITQHSFEQLHESLDALVGKDWILPELKSVLMHAKEICKEKSQ